jgi:hypothetical protein
MPSPRTPKPRDVFCVECGVEFQNKPGRGRSAKRCPSCRPEASGPTKVTPDAYQPRSLADHPLVVARLAQHGTGRTLKHTPGLRRAQSAGVGRVGRRGGAA